MDSIKRKSFNANVDLIHGPIFKSLIIFALPLFISNIFQQLYNTVDTMIVGNFLGDASLAAIGSCTSIYDLLVGFALGIGNGLAIVTARSFGSKDEKLLKKSVASSLVIGIVVSIGLTLIGLIFLQPLLHLLNTPANIIDEAYSYIFFIVLFIIVMFAYNLCAGLMRAIGHASCFFSCFICFKYYFRFSIYYSIKYGSSRGCGGNCYFPRNFRYFMYYLYV